MPTAGSPYNDAFYDDIGAPSLESARMIAPILVELLHPRSVVDVGCGIGSWLRAFRELGTTDLLGIDGAYVDTSRLMVAGDQFLAADLSRPLVLGRSFDLVVSLEVAEHLPQQAADTFVQSLVAMGDAVFFSAAVPYQGGVDHRNEQWPAYWAAFFRTRGFVPIDALRDRVWANDSVEWWYAQNAILYVRTDALDRWPLLPAPLSGAPRSLVHPKLYLRFATAKSTPWSAVRRALGDVRRALRGPRR
jgi:SAM-dependent methyltransferase